ncbi:hypothetical protein [Nitrosomonas marina]|nr:hypothetical protein [Nitrosomonas marina]
MTIINNNPDFKMEVVVAEQAKQPDELGRLYDMGVECNCFINEFRIMIN